MSTQCLGQAAGVPSSWRRPLTWLTIVLCLLPLSAGWFIGAWAASGLLVSAALSALTGHSVWGTSPHHLGWGVLFFIPAVAAGLGVAALWSALLPRALGFTSTVPLRGWQLLGLRLGSLVAVVFVAVLLISGALFDTRGALFGYSGLMWLVVLSWSLVAARCLAGESHQWLLIP